MSNGAIDLLKAMISRPSFSREEGELADFLEKTWGQDGQRVCRKGNNLWLVAPEFDAVRPTILLNSHIDTVKPVAGWTKHPFTATEDGGKIYGLGSNDAGASLVALYETFRILGKRRQPYNLIFIASCEEEVSGRGGAESALADLPQIDFAVVGEPTGMQPAVAEKGLLVLDCTATGKAGHAARNEGINAITEAFKAVEWFHTYQFPKQSGLLGQVKMTVTMIHAGTQHNVIPDACTFTADIRTNEFYSNREIYEEVKRLAGCEVKPRSLRLNSSRTDASHPFVQRALAMGKKPFGSPTLSDQSVMNFPSVKIGPGDSARSHTADEYILAEEISGAIDEYVRLLDGLQLGGQK